jgi:hypothetical protein
MAPDATNCRKCAYFRITWDKRFPYGCEAVGFKSRRMPSFEVLAASGKTCMLFRDKKNAKGRSKGGTRGG